MQTCSHVSHTNCQTGELFVLMNLYVIANEQCEYVGGAQQSYQQMMHSTGRRAITLVHQLPPWPLSRPRSRSSLIVVTSTRAAPAGVALGVEEDGDDKVP